jgi:hypothetical protein
MPSEVHLSPVDLAIVAVYLACTVLAGVVASRQSST